MPTITTDFGSPRIEKHKIYKYSNIGRAVIHFTLENPQGERFHLEQNCYGTRSRQSLTKGWVEEQTQKMIENRKEELEAKELRVVGIMVEVISSVWSTPYADLYEEES